MSMTDARKIYGDIIDREHHVSKKRTPMPRANRAAQFSPFAALTGYDELVLESARVTDMRAELTEDEAAELDMKLRILREHVSERPRVSISYFSEDGRKAGGAYIEASGRVKRIRELDGAILLHSGAEVFIEDICGISCDLFL